jgi:hypothetical protein
MTETITIQIRQGTNRRFTAHTPDGERIRIAMRRTAQDLVMCIRWMGLDGRFGTGVTVLAQEFDMHGRPVGRGWHLVSPSETN